MRADTQTISIDTAPDQVQRYLGGPQNLPRWAVGFARAVRPATDGGWVVETGAGEMGLRIDESLVGSRVSAVRLATSVTDAAMLAGLVDRSRAGDGDALDGLVGAPQHDVYRLALRMTSHLEDAEDATQEVLVKVITRLESFRGEASVRTWAYRIAVHHLLDRRKSPVETLALDFGRFGADLLDGLAAQPDPDPLLAEEVKRGCTLAMLTCLDRDHRLAFVLSDVFDLSHAEAADLCQVSTEVYRQRISRARRALEAFTRSYCGLVSSQAPCRCDRRVARAEALGRLNRRVLTLAQHPADGVAVAMAEMDALHESARVMRLHPPYVTPARVRERLRATIAGFGGSRAGAAG